MISHVHRIFPLLQHTKMWLFIQHESPQQELLLKLLENLYRKLLKIAHIYIRNCSSKFINSSTCSSNYLKWNFSPDISSRSGSKAASNIADTENIIQICVLVFLEVQEIHFRGTLILYFNMNFVCFAKSVLPRFVFKIFQPHPIPCTH